MEELIGLDWPLFDPKSSTAERGTRRLIHAAYHSGLMIAIIGIEGDPLCTSLASYSIKLKKSTSFQQNPRKPPPVLPKQLYPCDITAIAIGKEYIIMACDMKILVWSRKSYSLGDLASPKEYDLRQAEKDTDSIIDIIVRDGCIIALTKSGQVCYDQGPKNRDALEPWSRSPKLGSGAKGISMSQDKEKVIFFVDYPTCVKTVYFLPHKLEFFPGGTLQSKSTFHKNGLCEAIAIAKPSADAITPYIDIYSTLSDESIELWTLNTTFSEHLGQYMAFTFDSHSITYFGSKGIVRLDYTMHAEKKGELAVEHSSRYITLKVLDEVEQAGVSHKLSEIDLNTSCNISSGLKRSAGATDDSMVAKRIRVMKAVE